LFFIFLLVFGTLVFYADFFVFIFSFFSLCLGVGAAFQRETGHHLEAPPEVG